MGSGPLSNDGVGLLLAVLGGTNHLHLIVCSGNQIAAANNFHTGFLICRCAANLDAFGFIRQPHHIGCLICLERGRQQESVHCNAGQIIIAAGHIVRILGAGYRNGIYLAAAAFRGDRNGHLGGAIHRQGRITDGHRRLAIVSLIRQIKFTDLIRNRSGIASHIGAESRTDGSIAYRQALQRIIRRLRRQNGGRVTHRSHIGICLTVRSDQILDGYRQFCSGRQATLYLKGCGKNRGIFVDGVRLVVVIRHKIISVELYHPRRGNLLGGFGQGQFGCVVGQRTGSTQDTTAIDFECQGNRIPCPYRIGSGQTG